jgi:hypothetical protein
MRFMVPPGSGAQGRRVSIRRRAKPRRVPSPPAMKTSSRPPARAASIARRDPRRAPGEDLEARLRHRRLDRLARRVEARKPAGGGVEEEGGAHRQALAVEGD